MGRHFCAVCGKEVLADGPAEMNCKNQCCANDHYEDQEICEDCFVKLEEEPGACSFCDETCQFCPMVTQDSDHNGCIAPGCPLQERLDDNCCEDCWVQCTKEWRLKKKGKHECYGQLACGHTVCDLTQRGTNLSDDELHIVVQGYCDRIVAVMSSAKAKQSTIDEIVSKFKSKVGGDRFQAHKYYLALCQKCNVEPEPAIKPTLVASLTRNGDDIIGNTLSGSILFSFPRASITNTASSLREQLAVQLRILPQMITLLAAAKPLNGDEQILDLSSIVLKYEACNVCVALEKERKAKEECARKRKLEEEERKAREAQEERNIIQDVPLAEKALSEAKSAALTEVLSTFVKQHAAKRLKSTELGA